MNAIFFLPDSATNHLPSPTEAVAELKEYVKGSGRKISPRYTYLLDVHAHLVAKRGDLWLKLPTESVADSFLRRLPDNDPAREMFAEYITEAKERWAKAVEISMDDAKKRLKIMEGELLKEAALHQVLQNVTEGAAIDDAAMELVHRETGMTSEDILTYIKQF